MEKYHLIDRVGEGTFGVVHKAKDVETGKVVALKKISKNEVTIAQYIGIKPNEMEEFPKNALREAKTLQHVVKLFEVFPRGANLILVLEFMKTDLARILRNLRKPLPESHVKTYAQMMLRGIEHCHAMNIVHRDIKPANLLISPTGELKLGDFGLATVYVGNHKSYSHQVATRWYRAPELLYGSRSYNQKVDLWSAGCVIAEMLNHSPLFAGENDIDQLHTVLKSLGTPTEENWPGVSKLPDFSKITFTKMNPVPFNTLMPNASFTAIDLLSKLLVYDSDKRYSAKQALCHEYFYTEPFPVHFSELEIPEQSYTKPEEFKGFSKTLDEPFVLPQSPPN